MYMKMKVGLYAAGAPLVIPKRALSSFFSTKAAAAAAAAAASSSLPPLLDREWMLPDPAVNINRISISVSPSRSISYSNNPQPSASPAFYLLRDDLLHPLVNGNKARKLDALLPILRRHSATDVLTCGGCQSAHAAALAVSCAERGMRAHLLLRGEQPEVPTGYNLISLMYGNVSYVARSDYANREEMLDKHAELVAGKDGRVLRIDDLIGRDCDDCSVEMDSRKRVVVVNEGAGDVAGLLGVIRLVRYLSEFHLFGKEQHVNIVVDAGTGTTAVGLALGALWLGLPWRVSAVMLADSIERYKEREKLLISSFKRIHQIEFLGQTFGGVDDSIVHWVERTHPRKFGKVLNGEIERCRQIAAQTGVLLDPVYTLAAWEHAVQLSLVQVEKNVDVVMLHTGGTLGMFGLAQRYPSYFVNSGQVSHHQKNAGQVSSI